MSKMVRRLRSDEWRIGEHESWFADMAAQGLHLKKLGRIFARFERGEPKRTRYRIDVSIHKKMSEEQMELYEEGGWEFVTQYGAFYVFSSPAEREAPELHTDPAEQAYTLRELDKKLFGNALFILVALLLIAGMLSSLWFLDRTPVYMLVEGMAVQQTVLTVVIGYQAYIAVRGAVSIRALQKRLNEGRPIDHHAPYRKRWRRHTFIALLFLLFAAASAVMPIMYLVKEKTATLPGSSPELPIVRLAEIEQNPELIREPYMIDDVDWANRYSYNWSPLAPLQYDTDESGTVPGETWDDESGGYSPSLHTKVYRLSMLSLADPLVSDLVKRYQYGNEQFIETAHPDLDRLLVHEDAEVKEIVARRGKAVVYVRYHGYAELEAVLTGVVAKMGLIAE
ncbi:hypothetical protein OXB_2647 [Bacillus sp. OxB-1]|uniref:DUF2812 domain-containing protein n=1 Tax=Bacillus sp. (strain OxB-1) TaxID=98228 RepID=UPI000581C677|nr:DUF2812 domain-containing protein [Bacillus sp. OxB-1]BAQ11118.1 hypothetical protein OXB_2647 [Bacillus sp. OxB-1]